MTARKFSADNYITIQGWMITELRLSGTDLILFALIYGFSQDEESEFNGSLSYMMSATGTSKPTVIKALKGLVAKGLVKRTEKEVHGITFCTYKAIFRYEKDGSKETLPPVKNEQGGSKELEGGSKETLPNNYIYNKYNIIEKPISINRDSQKEKEEAVLSDVEKKEAKTLFRNSAVAKEMESEDGILDGEKLAAYFQGEKYKDVDLEYYYHTVSDWSETSGTKRTARGWMATIRTFIREDEKRGHLCRISNEEKKRRLQQMFDEVGKRYFGDNKDDQEDALWTALSVGDANK
jgi:DNA-binding transcriptional regulator GbsR (MarR family)